MKNGWTKYRAPKSGFEQRDSLFIVRLKSGTIHLGEFYCGEFVINGRGYNQTPGLLPFITHFKAVKAP